MIDNLCDEAKWVVLKDLTYQGLFFKSDFKCLFVSYTYNAFPISLCYSEALPLL